MMTTIEFSKAGFYILAMSMMLPLGCGAPRDNVVAAPDASPTTDERPSDVESPPMPDMVCDDKQTACACNDVVGCKR
jgi:hypothetical protein